MAYVGRFAPSPTGPLHAGSLVAALASWLDARAHGGRWLVRIEDVDMPRCTPGADAHILGQLDACSLRPDATPWWQSKRSASYETALQRLFDDGWIYACGCSRKDIEDAWSARGVRRLRGAELPYPGTCRNGLGGKQARALRMRTGASPGTSQVGGAIDWLDRRLGPQTQNLKAAVGDFVLRRADGLWAYQLAVVVDDADQGVTDVVRGADLADNTPRQIHLQQALALPRPRYLHTPLVLGGDGEKLSKQNAARPLALGDPLATLKQAGATLGIHRDAQCVGDWLAQAVLQWRENWCD